MALSLLLLAFAGCRDGFHEELQPNSLLPAVLPDIQVPLSDSGTGTVDISSAIHLAGAYSVKFGKPKHGDIKVSGDSTIFRYVAHSDFNSYGGRDTASYMVTRKGNATPSEGKLIFYITPNTCFVKAVDDKFETTESGPYLINVLTNDFLCGDTLSVESIGSPGRHGVFAPHPTNGALITYAPDSIDAYHTDSTTYTIRRNGLTSTAKLVVKRTRTVDCAAMFQPKDDIVYIDDSLQSLEIPFDSLFKNDVSCGDINRNSLTVGPPYTDLTATCVPDYQNEVVRCTFSSPVLPTSSVTYTVKRLGASQAKSAKIYFRVR